jgi:hypothetical protein
MDGEPEQTPVREWQICEATDKLLTSWEESWTMVVQVILNMVL